MSRGSPHHHPFTDATRGVRLQKVLAEAGVASRRACEDLIESGEVRVNGQAVCSLPAWVDPQHDRITVRGRRVGRTQQHVYVMLYKPRGVVCTNADPQQRKRAVDLVNHPSRARLFPVGRLDMDSTGLLLLTNDGELANRMTHPRHGIHKRYEVTLDGMLDDALIRKLQRGLYLHDRRSDTATRTAGARLTLLQRDRRGTRLTIELREGRNRQIRRLMAATGCRVRRLRRVQAGPLKLRGLRPGQWRDLQPRELAALRRVVMGGKGLRD